MRDIEVIQCDTKFNPIKISFTIESEEELIELWTRLNISNHKLNEIEQCLPLVEKQRKKLGNEHNFSMIWNALEDILRTDYD